MVRVRVCGSSNRIGLRTTGVESETDFDGLGIATESSFPSFVIAFIIINRVIPVTIKEQSTYYHRNLAYCSRIPGIRNSFILISALLITPSTRRNGRIRIPHLKMLNRHFPASLSSFSSEELHILKIRFVFPIFLLILEPQV